LRILWKVLCGSSYKFKQPVHYGITKGHIRIVGRQH